MTSASAMIPFCRAPLSLFPPMPGRSLPAAEFGRVSARGLFHPYWLGGGGGARGDWGRSLRMIFLLRQRQNSVFWFARRFRMR